MISKAQIAEALNTVLEINGDDTQRCASLIYAGHVKGIFITVFPEGWRYGGGNKTIEYSCYEDMPNHYSKSDELKDKQSFDTFDQLLEDVRKAGI